MRAFIDSNIFIASAISDSEIRRLLNRILRTHKVVISEEVIAEVSRKLTGKFKQDKSKVQKWEAYVRGMAVVLPRQAQAPKISRDPKDDWVLTAAVEGDCDCILSGDEDLVVLRRHRGIPILRPRDFLAFEDQRRYSRRKRR